MTGMRFARPVLMLCMLLSSFLLQQATSTTPIVLMHGITDNTSRLAHVVSYLQQQLPGVYVHNAEIGDGKWDSIFWGVLHQVNALCSELKADPKLAGGFNLIGFSQGGIINRGYLELCNDPPVKNFVSWVSPQMGVYGVPVLGDYTYLNETLDEIADCCAYDPWAQDNLSFFGYWRDPYALPTYVDKCVYLSPLNNERSIKNPTYKQNVLSLKNFIMGYSLIDDILIPKETGWFGTYAANSTTVVVPLEQQTFYINDWIGLRTLSETGRLLRFTTTCAHNDYDTSCFDSYFTKYVLPFLKD